MIAKDRGGHSTVVARFLTSPVRRQCLECGSHTTGQACAVCRGQLLGPVDGGDRPANPLGLRSVTGTSTLRRVP